MSRPSIIPRILPEWVWDSLPVNGWLSRDEAELLWGSASEYAGPILEVGVYYGRSTVLLAALGRQVYCVDPFAGFDSDDPSGQLVRSKWQVNIKSRGIRNCILYPVKIEDWSPTPVGFAHLDGDHTYAGTKAQIQIALLCGPSGITVHDFNDSGGGAEVKRACLELLGEPKVRAGRMALWNM